MAVIPRIEDLADPTFDPYLSDELVFGDLDDPYPRIAELRARAPVHAADYRAVVGIHALDGEGAPPHFMVLSYAGVDQILNDPVTFSNRSFEPTLGAAFGHTVSVMDPPEHTRYRRILQQAFRPSIVQEWGADIVAPVVEELVGAFRDTGRAELVEQFARPYPFTVIYRMLGLPQEDIDTFYKLTIAQIITYPDMRNALDASAKLGRYFTAMLAARRTDPGRDVVSVLATTEVDGEPLPDEVAISFLRQLINAGGDTTFRTTTMLLTGLLRARSSSPPCARTDRWSAPPSRRHCGGTARCWRAAVWRPPTPWSTVSRSRPERSSTCSTVPPTTTPPCSLIPRPSTSSVPSTVISDSHSACTTASASSSPASSSAGRSTRCSTSCPTCGSIPSSRSRRRAARSCAHRRSFASSSGDP